MCRPSWVLVDVQASGDTALQRFALQAVWHRPVGIPLQRHRRLSPWLCGWNSGRSTPVMKPAVPSSVAAVVAVGRRRFHCASGG